MRLFEQDLSMYSEVFLFFQYQISWFPLFHWNHEI